MLQILAFLLPTLCGTGAAIAFGAGQARFWISLITGWLSVPLGIVSYAFIGLYLAEFGGCKPAQAARRVTCNVLGIDISDWVNGTVFGGYAFAFVGLPWFLIGGVIVVITLISSQIRRNKT